MTIYHLSTNVNCVCTNSQFKQNAHDCIQQRCSAADLQNALALQTSECVNADGAYFFFFAIVFLMLAIGF